MKRTDRKRKTKNQYARTAMSRLFITLAVFTASYWGLFILSMILLNGQLRDIIYYILGYRLYDVLYSYGDLLLLFFYCVTVLLLCFRAVYRVAEDLRLVTDSLSCLLDKRQAAAELPPELSDAELKLREIKYSFERSEQAAREAEQRKNDLVVYLAHDLKTPLTSVIGYLSMLEESPELPAEQRIKYNGIALKKAYRLESLINEFFEITRFNLQSIVLERNQIDLSLMLLQMADEFSPIFAERNLTAETDIPSGLRIVADADKLARVFDNLLRNAVSYSYPDTAVRISAKADGEGVTVTVRNSGDEIPPQKAERIFEKFFRVDTARGSRQGGAGLGLAIAKHITELHGGRIGVKSNSDYTEFFVWLPKESARQDIHRT